MNILPIYPYLSQILSGIGITLALLICAISIGFIFSSLFAIVSSTGKIYFKLPIDVFTFVIRGTPLLIQFFIIYFGSSQFDWLRNSFLWIFFKRPFVCAIIALVINNTAFATIILRGAINSVPKGEIEACKALGMSWWLMMQKIIFPRALRIVLPAYSNEVVMILKGTSLASTITLLDLLGVIRQIIAETYAAIEFLILAGVIYFLINLIIISGFHWAERKFNAYQSH
jgi:arginine transport system permease protein